MSLAVDEDDIKEIKPLPNLDYKIVCGNSLLGVEKNLFNSELFKELEKLKPLLFNATGSKKKHEYKNRINELISEITNGHKDFDFEVYFSEVFHAKKGFDVVIANPPYVRHEDIKSFKPALQKEGYEVYNSTSDLYTYFYEKSYHILKRQGFSCFISSNKWMRAKYGEKLRKFFKEKCSLKQIIDFNGYQVFDATVDTNVLLFQKTILTNGTVNILNIKSDFTKETDINEYFAGHNLEMKQSALDIKCFTFGDDVMMNLKKKIENKGTPLKEWDVKIYYGIKTGFNEAFIIDTATKERLCREDTKSAEIIKPILRGRDINKYYYQWAGLWVIKVESGWTNKNRNGCKPELFLSNRYTAVYNYLKNIGDKVERGEIKAKGKGLYKRDDQGDYWWELRDCNYYPEFEKEKIIYPNMTKFLPFVYDDKKYYTNQKCYILTGKTNLKFLLSVLNSSLFSWYIRLLFPELQGGTRELNENVFREIPISKIPEKAQMPFISLVDKIILDKQKDYNANTSAFERQIDQMVYKLYDISQEEIKIIQNDSIKN